MFKRIAAVTLMFGAALAVPAVGSAQEFRRDGDRDFDRGRFEYRDREFRESRQREYRERLERERRERFEANRFRYAGRGFYDRAGCWQRY